LVKDLENRSTFGEDAATVEVVASFFDSQCIFEDDVLSDKDRLQ